MKRNPSSISKQLLLSILFLFLASSTILSQQAICDGFEERRQNFIEQGVNNTSIGISLFVLQAYSDLPIDTIDLAASIENLPLSGVPDFNINEYVRLLYFSNGEYDDIILSVLKTIPFWLPDNAGNNRQYWTENHMIQWMSADWLLYEKYDDWEVRPSLRSTIIKYLEVKIEYGYYEYFSYYNLFSLTALLNLYDFVQDEEIKEKSRLAIDKMLKDQLLMVNNKGVYLPTAGRYETSYLTRNFKNNAIYLMTELKNTPDGAGRDATALATSSIDLSSICESWSEVENITLNYGHSINDFSQIYEDLTDEDRITFQWSAGGYFPPPLASQSLWQIDNYDLWSHDEFADASLAQFLPNTLGNLLAEAGSSISVGSFFGEAEIDIYKNKGIVLSSTHDKFKGKLGYQIYPIMANIETTPVFIRSGEVYDSISAIPNRKSNEHMPYVSQTDNVALVMFRPNFELSIIGFDELDVALRWDESVFDEIVELGKWSIGRIDNSYIGILKHCTERINGIPACDDEDGQTWSIIVGNSDTHNSFDEFQDVIKNAFYEERWYYSWSNLRWAYYGHINIDGKDIDHHWIGTPFDAPVDGSSSSSGSETITSLQEESYGIALSPNPSTVGFNLDLSKYEKSFHTILVINDLGKTIYQEIHNSSLQANNINFIATGDWEKGVYTIVIENKDGSRGFKRLVVLN